MMKNTWRTSPTWLRPAIQLTGLMTTLGHAISPQIVSGVLDGYIDYSYGESSTVTTISPEEEEEIEFWSVRLSYTIVGFMNGLSAVACLIMCVWTTCSSGYWNKGLTACLTYNGSGEDDEVELIPESPDAPSHASEDKLEPSSRQGRTLLTVMFLFFLSNGGRDVLLTGLLFTYVFEYLSWTVDQGTLLVSVYQLTRFLAHSALIPLTPWIPPNGLMIFDLVTLLLSSVLMILALYDGDGLTTAGVIVAGLGTSNALMTSITVVDQSINVNAKVMAMFFAAIGLSSMIIAPPAGILLFLVGKSSFPLLLLGLTVCGIALFAVYLVLVHKMTKDRPK